MPFDANDRPLAPRLRPHGPVIRAEDTAIWSDAAAAIAAADLYAKRMKGWVRTVRARERERGYAEGRDAGAEEAARLVAATAARAEIFLRELERDLPDLVLGLVERVLGAFDPGDVLARAVVEAVGRLRSESEIRVHVAPEQADSLRAGLAEIRRLDGAPSLRVQADPALATGQCVLHGASGTVELGMAAQLRALREGIESAWRERGAAGGSHLDRETPS